MSERANAVNGDACASEIVRVDRPVRTMSERLWDLDWSRSLPWRIGNVTVERGELAELAPFLQQNWERLFSAPDDRFLREPMSGAKRRFWAESDIQVFRCDGRMIGYSSGHPSDWSTYYCRSFSILPEFREASLATEISRRIVETVSASECVRIEAETSVANVPMTRILLGLGFLVTSISVSERWGTMLRLTKLVREDAARIFDQQYVFVPDFGRNPTTRGRRKGP